jgi:hypothetical protein
MSIIRSKPSKSQMLNARGQLAPCNFAKEGQMACGLGGVPSEDLRALLPVATRLTLYCGLPERIVRKIEWLAAYFALKSLGRARAT